MSSIKPLVQYLAARKRLLCMVMCIFWAPGLVVAEEDVGVLVVSSEVKAVEISHQEIRRLFLGLPADANSGLQQPLINEANKSCYKEFLKNVMFLTENGYQRKLVKRVFRQGADQIKRFESEQELVSQLIKNPGDVSFLYKSDLKKYHGLRVLKVLW